MSPLERIVTWWKGLFDTGAPAAAGGLLAGVLQSGQAPRRGTKELLQAYKRLPYLRSAVSKIANDVASVPFRLYVGQGGRNAKSFGTGVGLVRRKMLEDAKRTGELKEVVTHPLLDLLNTFNPALRAHTSRVLWQVYLDLVGEAFTVLERNGLGQPLELWPVPPTWITDLPTKATPFFRASYLGWQKLFAEGDVHWMRHADPENPYARGSGTGVALGDELDIDEQVAGHLKSWFQNRAMPSALVSMDIAQGEMDRLKESWNQDLRGAGKAGMVKFIGAKDLKVEQLGDTFREQQLVELRKDSRQVTREVLNIPPECMGIIENSNRATIDAAWTLYAQGVLCPRLDFQCDQLQPLAESFNERLVLDYPSPVPDDRDFKKSVMVALPTNFTIDEHRALACMEPLPNGAGEALYEPAGAGPLGLGEEPPPETGTTPPPKGEPADDTDDQDGEDTKASPRRSLRRKDSTLTPSELTRVLGSLRPERLAYEVRPVWQARVNAWGNRVLNELGVDVQFDIRNPIVRAHIEHFAGAKMKAVTDTTRESLRNHLSEGIALGEGVDELAKRVDSLFADTDRGRARTIARTEVVGSSNFANLRAFEMSGVVERKEWLSVQDGNTRETHRQLDGTVVELGKSFVTSDGHHGAAPGQFGVAAEDINCRCSCLPVVAEVKNAADRVAVWKRYDSRAAAWERVALAALRRGFRHQKADLLAALR